jgi:hypothetical protein
MTMTPTAATKKMAQATTTARRRFRDLRAADRGRAAAARGRAAGAMAVFLPVDDLSTMGYALHQRRCRLSSTGKLVFSSAAENLNHRRPSND